MAMLAYVLLLCVITTSSAATECSYSNQDTTRVAVTLSSSGFPSNAQVITINEGESITLSCIYDVNDSFKYNVLLGNPSMEYTCTTGSSNVVSLPICASKCTKTKDLSDGNTLFELKDGTDVSTTSLPDGTPVTVTCSGAYAQKFGQSAESLCSSDLTSDVKCKEMCSLSSYNTDTTTVDGEGIETLSGSKYLKVGYDVKITCTKSDYGLPDGADSSHECSTEGTDIDITSCLKKCSMDSVTEPDGTTYSSTQTSLFPGQSFQVSCSDATLMLPYGSPDKVVCGDDGKFPSERPACVATCEVPAVTGSTTLNTTKSVLAQNEAIEVSCEDYPTESLPYPHDYPLKQTCNEGGDLTVPSCQKTCSKPDDPDNAKVTSSESQYSFLAPVSVKCDSNYVYKDSVNTVKEFTCKNDNGNAVVTIDEFCYIQAKVRTKTTGSGSVQIQGNLDLDSSLLSDVTVNISVVGTSYDSNKNGISPNSFQEFTVSTYQPLNVTVYTTRSSEATIVENVKNSVYPGPPEPLLVQSASSSETVQFNLAPEDNAALTAAISIEPPSYELTYTVQSEEISRTIESTISAPVTINGLTEASTYIVRVKLILSDTYGGSSSQASYNVYTGPGQVSDVTWTIKENEVTVKWSEVSGASSYTVQIFQQDSDKFHSTTTPHLFYTVDLGTLSTEQLYNLNITASLKVDGTSYNGDTVSLTDNKAGVQAPGDGKLEIENLGTSVTIKRVVSTKRSTGDTTEYVVFLAEEDGPTKEVTMTTAESEKTVPLSQSSTYSVYYAEAFGSGYGFKTFIKDFKTADCPLISCINCADSDYFNNVLHDQVVLVKCASANDTIKLEDETEVKELSLKCSNNLYVFTANPSSIFESSDIECLKAESPTEAVIDPVEKENYLVFYIVGGIALFVLILVLIILIFVRRRRTQGSYDAKKVKESNIGDSPPKTASEATPRTIAYDNNYFESKWDRELAATRSARSKATSYGSQELRMEIADSDSGITEDLDNTFPNPIIFSSEFDDTVSTKSALV